MKIAIITAALPPRLDGIGDYTALLAARLAQSATVQILTSNEFSFDPIPGIIITPAFHMGQAKTFWNILEIVKESQPDWVLLQYNPFSYGKWGRNLELPRVMSRVKKVCPRTRIALMAHETFVPVVNWKFAAMTLWQRWQFWSLGQSADEIFFSIEAWMHDLQSWFPGKRMTHLPVGSNIPRVLIPREEARTRLGVKDGTVVIGLFGALHISRLMAWTRLAAQAVSDSGRDVQVLYIGAQCDAVREQFKSIPILSEGPLPAEEISRRFAAMDVFLSPFTDGVSTRRGSFMASLQHGIASVATRGHHTDSVLDCEDGKALLLADVHVPSAFNHHVLALLADDELRLQIGANGQRLYEENFTWDRIAKRLLERLGSHQPPMNGETP